MKKDLRLAVFIFAVSLAMFLPDLGADVKPPFASDAQPEISMDFQNATLKDILKVLSMQSGLNFVASEAVQDRTVTLYLDKVPLDEAMKMIFKANNLSYELDKTANIFIVKDWGKVSIETVTRVFHLKYATVLSSKLKQEIDNQMASTSASTSGSSGSSGSTGSSSSGSSSTGSSGSSSGSTEDDTENTGITKSVRKLLSENGSVIEDFRTNSLIVTDTPSRMETIAGVIAALDVAVPQVMMEVEMLDVSKNTIDKLGMDWSAAGAFSMQIISAARMTSFPLGGSGLADRILSKVTSSARVGGDSTKYNAGEINFPTNLKWVFNYLRTEPSTRILARPRVLSLNNETAEIMITTQEAIGTIQQQSSGGSLTTQTTAAERVETGVHLRVTPQINADTSEITMFIYPRVRDATVSTFNTSFKDPEERSTKTSVRIKDGDTVIIGGLIRRDRSETITSVPYLSRIPLLGKMFFEYRNKDKDRERELLVFITPHIIRETNIKLAQMKRAVLPEREQSSTNGAGRDMLVNSAIKNFEAKKK